jgi:hypothetical protein
LKVTLHIEKPMPWQWRKGSPCPELTGFTYCGLDANAVFAQRVSDIGETEPAGELCLHCVARLFDREENRDDPLR